MLDQLLRYKIGITLLDGIGDINSKKLVSHCGGIAQVFEKQEHEINKIATPSLKKSLYRLLHDDKTMKKVEEEIIFIKKHQIKAISYLDKEYPQRLKYCDDAPLLLYYKGKEIFENDHVLGVVGTRSATDHGKSQLNKIIKDLTPYNPLIISGMAYGIDITAHKAALANKLSTIGVVGHGLDRLYPSEHLPTAKKMFANGGIITEHHHNCKFIKSNFPRRNRIIAGMCDALLVVESAVKGGSLITADIAFSYNRDVLAIPGRAIDKYSAGCNMLIKTQKAQLVESADDIIEVMGWKSRKKTNTGYQKTLFNDLTEDEQMIVTILQNDKVPIDLLCLKANIPQSKISGLLLTLEFKGVICCFPGKMYALT